VVFLLLYSYVITCIESLQGAMLNYCFGGYFEYEVRAFVKCDGEGLVVSDSGPVKRRVVMMRVKFVQAFVRQSA
jgi:hypothetical protein